MTAESFISTYGYLAVLIGTLLEGETVLIVAGILAHGGLLYLPWVIAAAFAGSVTGDQVCFRLGRAHGRDFIARRGWTRAADRLQSLLARRGALFVAGFRFLYGLRMVSPIVIGTVGYPAMRFTVLNLCGALAWSIAIASAGYLFGQTVQLFLAGARRYEIPLVAGVAAISVVAAFLVQRHRRRAMTRPQV